MVTRLRTLSVATRLIGGFAAVSALLFVLGWIALEGLFGVHRSYAESTRELSRAQMAMCARADLLEEVWAQKNYVIRGLEEYLPQAQESAQRVDTCLAGLADAAADDGDQAALRTLRDQIRELRDAFERAADVRRLQGVAAADAVVRGKAAAAIATLDAFASRAEARSRAAAAVAARQTRRTHNRTVALVLAIGAFAILLGIVLSVSITRPVANLRRAVETVAAGGTPEPPSAHRFRDELTRVSEAFYDLVQRASLLQEMETRSRRLEALSARVVRAQEEERGRIARELHDSLGQALTAIRFELSAAAAAARGRADDVTDRLTSARKLVGETLDEVRRLALDLRPPALDTLGLVAALRSHARQYSEWSQTRVTVDESGPKVRLPPQEETALYRIVQEALANVAKHAEASHATVELKHEDSTVTLIIRDDGRGMDLKAVAKERTAGTGLGLLSMAQRAQELGGSFKIESAPGEGTTIRVQIPVCR